MQSGRLIDRPPNQKMRESRRSLPTIINHSPAQPAEVESGVRGGGKEGGEGVEEGVGEGEWSGGKRERE